MLSRWTQHLSDPQDKERFKLDVSAARRVLERLDDILKEDEAALDRSEFDHRNYSVANWSHLQAHRNGNKQTYAEIKKYLRPERD